MDNVSLSQGSSCPSDGGDEATSLASHQLTAIRDALTTIQSELRTLQGSVSVMEKNLNAARTEVAEVGRNSQAQYLMLLRAVNEIGKSVDFLRSGLHVATRQHGPVRLSTDAASSAQPPQ